MIESISVRGKTQFFNTELTYCNKITIEKSADKANSKIKAKNSVTKFSIEVKTAIILDKKIGNTFLNRLQQFLKYS